MLSNQEYAYECLTLTAEPKMQGAQASKSIIHLFLPCHMTLNMQILYERVDRWMDGQTDRHSLLSLVGIGSQGCNELLYPGIWFPQKQQTIAMVRKEGQRDVLYQQNIEK